MVPTAIFIKVKTGAKRNVVKKITELSYCIEVTTNPIHNKANNAVIKLLADYFHTKRSEVSIARGVKSNRKIVLIANSLK